MYEQDALSNGQTPTTDPAADSAAIRQRAMDMLLPSWIDARREVAEANGDVEGAKGELKHAKEVLGRVERNLEHVSTCRISACMVCEAIALNGAKANAVADESQNPDGDEERPPIVLEELRALLVVAEAFDDEGDLSLETMERWTEEQLQQVADWAAASIAHLEGVGEAEAPEMPQVLAEALGTEATPAASAEQEGAGEQQPVEEAAVA